MIHKAELTAPQFRSSENDEFWRGRRAAMFPLALLGADKNRKIKYDEPNEIISFLNCELLLSPEHHSCQAHQFWSCSRTTGRLDSRRRNGTRSKGEFVNSASNAKALESEFCSPVVIRECASPFFRSAGAHRVVTVFGGPAFNEPLQCL